MSTPNSTCDQTASNVCEWLPGYELLNLLGKGGCGVVYKAKQLALDRLVAIKLIRFDHSDSHDLTIRFEKEAVTLGKLHHPNIVQIFDYGRHDGRVYLTMELLEGEDLAQLLLREPMLNERKGWTIARQTATALAHAALSGVIHRDVKPANLFLTSTPTGWIHEMPFVKVLDFGLAFTKSATEIAETRLTRTNTTPGTPLYMAPEQSKKAADLDHRADIYALGATIFHALSGRPPFAGPTMWDLMLQKLDHKLHFESHLSKGTIELLKAMMAQEPRDRIGSYDELIARIDDLDVMKNPAPGRKVSRQKSQRPRGLFSLGGKLRKRLCWLATASLIGLVGAGLALRGESNSDAVYSLIDQKFKSEGDREFLFVREGFDITDWMPTASGGNRTTTLDDEKVKVLEGSGFTRRIFPYAGDFQVVIGLDVHKANAVELHFAIPESAPEVESRLVLRITRENGAELGTRKGDKGVFTSIKSLPNSFPDSSWFEDKQPYLEVKIRRAGGLWSAWFHGKAVGFVKDDATPKLSEFRVGTEGGGKWRIDSVWFTRLKEVQP